MVVVYACNWNFGGGDRRVSRAQWPASLEQIESFCLNERLCSRYKVERETRTSNVLCCRSCGGQGLGTKQNGRGDSLAHGHSRACLTPDQEHWCKACSKQPDQTTRILVAASPKNIYRGPCTCTWTRWSQSFKPNQNLARTNKAVRLTSSYDHHIG